MPTSLQRKLPLQAARPAYRTLQGWALGTLIDQGAVVECEHHGTVLTAPIPMPGTGRARKRGGTRSRAPHRKRAPPQSMT
jgi:hypothetical protein